MKKLIALVFAVFLLVSCSKKRQIHFDFIMTHNTNIIRVWTSGNLSWPMFGYGDAGAWPTLPIPVGTSWSTYRESHPEEVKIGNNISLTMGAICDSIGPNSLQDSIQCDFEVIVGFFVDGVLQEERVFSESVNGQTINFTVP